MFAVEAFVAWRGKEPVLLNTEVGFLVGQDMSFKVKQHTMSIGSKVYADTSSSNIEKERIL